MLRKPVYYVRAEKGLLNQKPSVGFMSSTFVAMKILGLKAIAACIVVQGRFVTRMTVGKGAYAPSYRGC